MTTLNKTMISYAAAVVAAEYILNINERGTHNWDKFVSPQILETHTRRSK